MLNIAQFTLGMMVKNEAFSPMNCPACYYTEDQFLGGKSLFLPVFSGKTSNIEHVS